MDRWQIQGEKREGQCYLRQ